MIPASRVLCPIDFSPLSLSALRIAVGLAGAADLPLHVLAVVEDGWPASAALPLGRPEAVRLEQALRDAVTALLPEGCRWRPAVEVSVKRGEAAAVIQQAAIDLDADLVVLGTHGHGPRDRARLGFTVERLLRTPPCSLLIVGPGERELVALGADRPVVTARRLLTATDFGRDATRAVTVAAGLARDWSAELVIAHVLAAAPALLRAPEAASLASYQAQAAQAAEDRLQALSAGLRGIRVSPCLLHGAAYTALPSLADRLQIDLIVMAAIGRGAPHHGVTGLTACRVAGMSPCPVLVLASPRQIEDARQA